MRYTELCTLIVRVGPAECDDIIEMFPQNSSTSLATNSSRTARKSAGSLHTPRNARTGCINRCGLKRGTYV